MSGHVIAIENGDIVFKPDVESFSDNLKLNVEFVSKYFDPGD